MLNDAATKSQRITGADVKLLRRFVICGLKMASTSLLSTGNGSLSIGVCLGIRRSLKRGSFVGIATAYYPHHSINIEKWTVKSCDGAHTVWEKVIV